MIIEVREQTFNHEFSKGVLKNSVNMVFLPIPQLHYASQVS